MTDNSPATDEEIAFVSKQIADGDKWIATPYVVDLIARIRAETVKNSGEAVRRAGLKARDELIERIADKKGGSPDQELAEFMEQIVDACVAAIPANSHAKNSGEAVGRDKDPFETFRTGFCVTQSGGGEKPQIIIEYRSVADLHKAFDELSAALHTPANSRATAWYRGVYQPSTPNGPEEYEVDMVWGEDAPDGDNWLPLYATPDNSRAEAILELVPVAWAFDRPDAPYRTWTTNPKADNLNPDKLIPLIPLADALRARAEAIRECISIVERPAEASNSLEWKFDYVLPALRALLQQEGE